MPDTTDRPLCANPDCRQPLYLVRGGREFCAQCETARGDDPWRWIDRTDVREVSAAVALSIEGTAPAARAAAERLVAESGLSPTPSSED